MADLTQLQATESVRLIGSDPTGLESTPVMSTTSGAIHSNLRNASGVEITSVSNGVAGNQVLHIQTPDTFTSTTALGALNASVPVIMSGLVSAGFQVLAGTLIGTFQPECSVDGGTTWVSCGFFDPVNSTVIPSLTFTLANTLRVLSVLPIGGASHLRVRVSAYTSGTANSLLRASTVTSVAGTITAAAFSTIANTTVTLTAATATLLLATNSNRKFAYFSNNSAQSIAIQLGTATGLTSLQSGLVIPSGSVYSLSGSNLYTGAVYGYGSSANLKIAVAEGTP